MEYSGLRDISDASVENIKVLQGIRPYYVHAANINVFVILSESVGFRVGFCLSVLCKEAWGAMTVVVNLGPVIAPPLTLCDLQKRLVPTVLL